MVCCSISSGIANASPPTPDPVNRQKGYWESPYNWGNIAIHMALLKGQGDTTEVLWWGLSSDAVYVWKVRPEQSISSSDIRNCRRTLRTSSALATRR